MTRKHFEAIAALLLNANRSVVDENGHPQAADILMADLCDATADYLATTNPHFNRDRFLTACGLGGRVSS